MALRRHVPGHAQLAVVLLAAGSVALTASCQFEIGEFSRPDASPGRNALYHRALQISAQGTAVPTDYTVALTFDHAALVAAGKSRTDGADVRIRCGGIEVSRVIVDGSQWDSSTTSLWFKAPAALAADASDQSCELTYGGPAAVNVKDDWSSSMGADGASAVFLYADDFEEHAAGDAADGWSNQGVEVFSVADAGGRRLRPMTRVRWQDGARATAMSDVADAVWSVRFSYWQEGTWAWGGLGVRVGTGAGVSVLVMEGAWYLGAEGFDGSAWITEPDLHLGLGSSGRLEIATHGDSFDASWLNPPGTSPARVELVTDAPITAAAGKLEIDMERPAADASRWVDADDVFVRKLVVPEPRVTVGDELPAI